MMKFLQRFWWVHKPFHECESLSKSNARNQKELQLRQWMNEYFKTENYSPDLSPSLKCLNVIYSSLIAIKFIYLNSRNKILSSLRYFLNRKHTPHIHSFRKTIPQDLHLFSNLFQLKEAVQNKHSIVTNDLETRKRK